jgi:hypothetical protein
VSPAYSDRLVGCSSFITDRRRLKRASRTARANAESMVASGVQPEFTCKLAVAGEEHGTDDADHVAGVRFVGVLKVGGDGLIERLFLHVAT